MNHPSASARRRGSRSAKKEPEASSPREQVDGVPRLLVLAKTRKILDAFTTDKPELTIPELTVRTELPPTTCFRLVRNLAYDGVLERIGDRYRIGVTVVRWASSALGSRNLVGLATETLDWLRDETSESALFCVRDGAVAVLVALANSRQSVVHQLHIGEVTPLHAGSTGKIFLAFDAEAVDALDAQPLPSFTPNTTTSRKQLAADIAAIRSAGFAASVEERHIGSAGLTAPVFDEQGRLAGSIGLTGPVSRMGEGFVERYQPIVLEAADRISRRLGYQASRGIER